jgi:acetyltransferase-like isoleucine patch superfamily enzyme
MQRIKYLSGLGKRIFKQRAMLLAKLESALKEDKFLKRFNYLPEGLEYNDVSILRLSVTSRLGKRNKVIIIQSQYPCSEKDSIISLGHNSWTGNDVELTISSGSQIIIKNYSSIQDFCKLIGDIIIEKYCLFAPSVFVSSGNHNAFKGNPDIIRNQDEYHLNNKILIREQSKTVHIEEDCWIGSSVFIKQGVYIGRGAVIGANAVITKDIMPYSIVAGVNQLINNRYDFVPPLRIQASIIEHKPYFYRGFFHKKGEYEEIAEKYIILGPDTGVVVLQKKELGSIYISGKLLNTSETDFRIVYNGLLKFSTQIKVGIDGIFNIKIDRSDFQLTNEFEDDDVLRLADKFNIIHISYSHSSINIAGVKMALIAFDCFEEM